MSRLQSFDAQTAADRLLDEPGFATISPPLSYGPGARFASERQPPTKKHPCTNQQSRTPALREIRSRNKQRQPDVARLRHPFARRQSLSAGDRSRLVRQAPLTRNSDVCRDQPKMDPIMGGGARCRALCPVPDRYEFGQVGAEFQKLVVSGTFPSEEPLSVHHDHAWCFKLTLTSPESGHH